MGGAVSFQERLGKDLHAEFAREYSQREVYVPGDVVTSVDPVPQRWWERLLRRPVRTVETRWICTPALSFDGQPIGPNARWEPFR